MQEVSEAIVLCGGKGKRLRSVTQNEIPKGLVPIKNKSILEWEIEWLIREGCRNIILAVGHLGETIKASLGNSYQYSDKEATLHYSFEREKLGSGGAFKLASQKTTSDRCLVVNGDILTNSNLQGMKKIHFTTGALATMYLVKMRSHYGVVETSGDFISDFREKPILDVYIHGGVDIIERDVFSRFPTKGQMEDTIFIELANEQKFAAFHVREKDFWLSIDSEKDFDNANSSWPGL